MIMLRSTETRTGLECTQNTKGKSMQASQDHRKPSAGKIREVGDTGQAGERLGVFEAGRGWTAEWRGVLLTQPEGPQ